MIKFNISKLFIRFFGLINDICYHLLPCIAGELRLLFNDSLSALFPTAVFVAAATNSDPGSSHITLLVNRGAFSNNVKTCIFVEILFRGSSHTLKSTFLWIPPPRGLRLLCVHVLTSVFPTLSLTSGQCSFAEETWLQTQALSAARASRTPTNLTANAPGA